MTDAELRDLSARTKQHAILVDFDGTLALKGERDPYRWSHVGEDAPNEPVVWAVRYLGLFATILIVSGRDESCRWQSEMWLHAYHVPFFALYMRPTGDQRPDHIVKRELYERHIQGQFRVFFAIDDRNSTVSLWRSLGIQCWQVTGEGDF